MDLLVVGELALDCLGEQVRPGGVAYSAIAAQKMGLRVGVAGPLGMVPTEKSRDLLKHLSDAGIDTSLVRTVDKAPLTRFVISNYDEVERQQLISGVPLSLLPLELPEVNLCPRAILLYPVHVSIWEQIVTRWPRALLAVDLQYNLSELPEFKKVVRKAQIVFASYRECLRWIGSGTVALAAKKLLQLGPSIVVVKFGKGGSAIYTRNGDVFRIPAFEAQYRYTIGAGDVYNAVFLALHMNQTPIEECGRSASLAASRFIERLDPFEHWCDPRTTNDNRMKIFLHPDTAAARIIYLAAPFFNQGEIDLVERVKACLEYHGFRVFSPLHEVGRVSGSSAKSRREAFLKDLAGLDKADLVVALTDGDDVGTAWECGYAYRANKPVITLSTEVRRRNNLMIEQGAKADFSSLRQLIDHLYRRFNELTCGV